VKYTPDHPYADPETAARKLIEIAYAAKSVQDGRIYIEDINAPFSEDRETRRIPRGIEFGRRARLALAA
jgi:hypothetical protein